MAEKTATDTTLRAQLLEERLDETYNALCVALSQRSDIEKAIDLLNEAQETELEAFAERSKEQK